MATARESSDDILDNVGTDGLLLLNFRFMLTVEEISEIFLVRNAHQGMEFDRRLKLLGFFFDK